MSLIIASNDTYCIHISKTFRRNNLCLTGVIQYNDRSLRMMASHEQPHSFHAGVHGDIVCHGRFSIIRMRQNIVNILFRNDTDTFRASHGVYELIVCIHVLIGGDNRGSGFLGIHRFNPACADIEHVLIQLSVSTAHDILCQVSCKPWTLLCRSGSGYISIIRRLNKAHFNWSFTAVLNAALAYSGDFHAVVDTVQRSAVVYKL